MIALDKVKTAYFLSLFVCVVNLLFVSSVVSIISSATSATWDEYKNDQLARRYPSNDDMFSSTSSTVPPCSPGAVDGCPPLQCMASISMSAQPCACACQQVPAWMGKKRRTNFVCMTVWMTINLILIKMSTPSHSCTVLGPESDKTKTKVRCR